MQGVAEDGSEPVAHALCLAVLRFKCLADLDRVRTLLEANDRSPPTVQQCEKRAVKVLPVVLARPE
jgi:hypothetical protein